MIAGSKYVHSKLPSEVDNEEEVVNEVAPKMENEGSEDMPIAREQDEIGGELKSDS